MNILHRCFVWVSRIHRSRGFGIQSPKDYAFVRYVVNEHWPYYAYDELKGENWQQQKMGRLYLRLANWRQPTVMEHDDYEPWWQAGCKKTKFIGGDRGQGHVTSDDTHQSPVTIELARMDIKEDWEKMATRCDTESVVVVENIWQNWQQWQNITHDNRVGTTYDLYYCGIVMFDKERFPHHYKVNF